MQRKQIPASKESQVKIGSVNEVRAVGMTCSRILSHANWQLASRESHNEEAKHSTDPSVTSHPLLNNSVDIIADFCISSQCSRTGMVSPLM